MTSISSVLDASAATQSSSNDAINNIDLNMFLKLMIAELQNQDPLNPLDNKDMLAQIAQIREVGATDKLTKTLDSVLLGQNIASATNLIGADIAALSDDGVSVAGVVHRVSIAGGVPKLHIDHRTEPAPSTEEGSIEAGTYAYRVVWEDQEGRLFGLDFSGDQAITTTGTARKDRAIELRNLPPTANPKYVYRTDASGEWPYQLVGFIPDGQQASFIDRKADDERADRLTREFQRTLAIGRSYQVSLNNVSSIRPPSVSSEAATKTNTNG
jgi:hypothetical protein